MDAREDILTAIRARGQGPREIPHIPDFSRGPGDLVGLFTEALARLDGQVVSQPPADIRAWLSATFPDARKVCSAVPEVPGTITPDEFSDWAAPADVDVTVVRTPLGVAETGSILVTEEELGVNTIAVLAQHLVVRKLRQRHAVLGQEQLGREGGCAGRQRKQTGSGAEQRRGTEGTHV